jgi:hypothetical protein
MNDAAASSATTPMEPRELVQEVFNRLHASDPTVSELYAEDAVRYGHDGRIHRGRAEIDAFYRSLFPREPPFPELECWLIQLPYVGALLRMPGQEGPEGLYMDLFEVADGAIRSIRVLQRP